MHTAARGGPARPSACAPPPPALHRTQSCRQCARATPSGMAPTRRLDRDTRASATAAGDGSGGGAASPPPPTTSGREFIAIADGGSRGARDVLDMSDYDSSDDGDLFGSAILRSLKRLDTPYAVIELADEVYARLVETDVSTADGPAKLAASLFGILPPPGYGSGPLHMSGGSGPPPDGPPSRRTSSTNGPESWYDLEALGERDLVALLRRLGRQAGAAVAIAVHELLDTADAGYPTRTRAMFGVLMHIAMLNGDGGATDAVWDKMVAAGFPPDDEAYNQAICAHAKAKDLDRAAALYASATAAGARVGDVTFSTFLSALEKNVPYYDGHDPLPSPPPPGTPPPWMTPDGAAAADRVRALWRDMGHQGVRPSTFTHRAVVASLARAGDLGGAWDAAREQAAAAAAVAGESTTTPLIPAVIGTHLTLGCLWLGDWEGARRGLADLAAGDPATAAGGADPGRLISDALRAGTPDGFAFALDAAAALRPLYWAPGAPGLAAARSQAATAEERAEAAAVADVAGKQRLPTQRQTTNGGGPDKQQSAPPPSTSKPSLLRLLAAAHELSRAADARRIAGWMVQEGWREPDPRAVGLMARTLAKGGDVDGAVGYLRPHAHEGRDARFGPALVALEAAAGVAPGPGRDAAVRAALDGPLASFAPPPGWHAARGPAAQSVTPPKGVTGAAGRPPPAAFAGGRRFSPPADRRGGGGGGGGGGNVSGSDRDSPSSQQGSRGGRRAPGPWGPQ